MVVIGSLPQLSGVSGEAFETWRVAALGDRRDCASDYMCERVPLAF